MPDKITVSTFQLFEMFPDQESARKYLESRLWPNGVIGNTYIVAHAPPPNPFSPSFSRTPTASRGSGFFHTSASAS